MGSPLSPILADIVLDDLETQCLGELNFDIPFFYRYVDDILTFLPKNKVDTTLAIFNNYHLRMKFTLEVENNGTINFLDTMVIRDNNKLITNWYQKPTYSGR